MERLGSYKKNTTSQWGEDGIVEEICRRLELAKGFCVEFGVWNGKHLSNTWRLWHNLGWSALLIEGDKKRFADLRETTRNYPEVVPYCAMVEPTGENSLDEIIKRLGQKNIDLLSVDIDGDDYYIIESLQAEPKIIIVEYNPTMPPFMSVVSGRGEYFGSSAKAIVELGEKKGYQLAAVTETNCFLIKSSEFPKLGIQAATLEKEFPPSNLTYLISSYDGVFFTNQIPPYAKTKRIERQKEISFTNQTELVPVSLKVIGLRNWRGKLRRLFKPLKPFYKKILTVQTVRRWKKQGRPVPVPHKIKEGVVIEYGKKFGAKTLVETGTYRGEMVAATKNHFEKIISVELDETLFREAEQTFQNQITILQGDSGRSLPEIVKNLSGPTLFWLDAHYSGGITAKGEEETPIISEVKTIAGYPAANIVLLIDDSRLFVGEKGYPKISDFKKIIAGLLPNHNFEIRDDIIRVTPRDQKADA